MMKAQIAIAVIAAPLPNSEPVTRPLPRPPHKGEGVRSHFRTIIVFQQIAYRGTGGGHEFGSTPSPLWGGLGRGFCAEEAIKIEKSGIRNQRS